MRAALDPEPTLPRQRFAELAADVASITPNESLATALAELERRTRVV